MTANRYWRGRAGSGRSAMAALVGLIVGVGVLAQPATAAPPAVPADELGSPAVTSLSSGRVDVFTRSSAGELIHRYRPSGGWWGRSTNLGGAITSQPAAVSWAPGRMDVFARGGDNRLWHIWYTGGRWSRWESLGTMRLTSAPAVASWQSGRLDVFARGSTGQLHHKWFESGSGWSAWTARGGSLTSSPAAASWAPGRLDVFARGAGNTLRHVWFASGSGWSSWESLGGDLHTQPAVASPGLEQLDVVMRGATPMWHKRFVRGQGWSAWRSLGGDATSGPAAVATGDTVRVAARWPSGRVYLTTRPSPTAAWSSWSGADPHRPFRGLGTWVDVFDYASLDPQAAVADMRARGVRTLYLSTGRFNGTSDFFDATEAGAWLDAAHAAGIRVVGWYVPAYGDMDRDVRRTVAISDFVSPGGQRFDAVGVDIERLDEVTRAQFNTRLVTHLQLVRGQTEAMIAAIVPSPFATAAGNNWEGFPWAAVGASSDVVVPMALWSFRDSCPGTQVCPFTPDQVYQWVRDQTQQARALTGRPVHVEGGVDDPGVERTPVTPARVQRFVDAVADGGAIGGSHYDYATTDPDLWSILDDLNG
jgi:hypothetical protein